MWKSKIDWLIDWLIDCWCIAAASTSESEASISFDGKSVAFDLGENRRGSYVRISEVRIVVHTVNKAVCDCDWPLLSVCYLPNHVGWIKLFSSFIFMYTVVVVEFFIHHFQSSYIKNNMEMKKAQYLSWAVFKLCFIVASSVYCILLFCVNRDFFQLIFVKACNVRFSSFSWYCCSIFLIIWF